MSLGAISKQFLQQVESITGLPIHVEAEERLQPSLLAKVQIARRGVPLHRVAYHPSARAMADYLINFQCSFVLRHNSMPPFKRSELADAQGIQPGPVDRVRVLAARAHLPQRRQSSFADPRFNDFYWLRKDDDFSHGRRIPPNGKAPSAQNMSQTETTTFKTAA